MIKLHIFAFIVTFLIVNQVSSHQQFQRYIDHWNYLARIEGQFQKNHTKMFQDAKCNPCDYLIIVYKDVIELLIDEPKDGNPDNFQAFEFTILDQHYNETWFDFDQQKYRLESARGTIQSIQRLTNMGSQWVYELTLPIQGLILKGRTSLGHQYLIPIVTFIFSIAIGFAFPLTSERRRQQSIQIPRRTPLICLLITSQLQHLLLIEIVVTSIKYLIYEESFLAKSLWYIVYVTPFAFLILQIVYLYDSIRVRFWTDFEKVKNVRFKDIGLLMSFFIGIYAATVLLLFLNKGIWVYAYFGIYLIWQILQSIIRKTYPYLSMSAYFFALVGYQMFLADYEPLFWFQQLTRLQIVVFWGLMFGLFILGSFLQKIFIGIQIVNQVLFQESKNIEMGQAGSAKQTQSNLDP